MGLGFHLNRLWLRVSRPALFRFFLSRNPVSREFGSDRGKAIDRYYIEKFLAENAANIKGHVLEVADTGYTQKYGNGVESSKYLTLAKNRGEGSILGDLNQPQSLPENQFDCFICTQTFQYLGNVETGVESAWRLLKPGGVFLGTMPAISQRSTSSGDSWEDHWRFNRAGLKRVFENKFGAGQVQVEAFGNVKVAACFLYGLALDEVSKKDLDYTDPEYECLITVIARKR